MKRPWLALSIALLALSILAPIVGLKEFMKRAVAYGEVREQRRAEGKTEAYLSEVQIVNRPGILGFATGASCLVGSISAFVIHRKKKKQAEGGPNKPAEPMPLDAARNSTASVAGVPPPAGTAHG